MRERYSVNPFAYGPGAPDIGVTFKNSETEQLRNVHLENQPTLQRQFQALVDRAGEVDKIFGNDTNQLKERCATRMEEARVAYEAEVTAARAELETAIESKTVARDQVIRGIDSQRLKLEGDAFALAEEQLDKAEAHERSLASDSTQ